MFKEKYFKANLILSLVQVVHALATVTCNRYQGRAHGMDGGGEN